LKIGNPPAAKSQNSNPKTQINSKTQIQDPKISGFKGCWILGFSALYLFFGSWIWFLVLTSNYLSITAQFLTGCSFTAAPLL
jgi:hypothetical protein